MSAFDIATLILFPWLGLVALAIGLLAGRYSGSALVVGLTGLFTIAAAITWITATGPVADTTQLSKLMSENAELNATIAGQQAELEVARRRDMEPAPRLEPAERQSSHPEIERLARELQHERRRRADAERSATDADRRAAAATASAADLNAKMRETQNSRLEAERKALSLEERLRGMQPPPPKPPDLQRIRRRLAEGERQFYATQEERPLIPEETGAWYVVRLLQGGRDWEFADRQFVQIDPTQIKTSIARLRDDVLAPLSQAGKRWRLFVRGAADPRRVAGPISRELSYLPLLPDGTFGTEPNAKRLPVPVENEDLPNLRAEWLREIVLPMLGAVSTGRIDILQNPPKQGHGKSAELVLFVEW